MVSAQQAKTVKFCGIDCRVHRSDVYQQNRRQAVLQLVAASSEDNERRGVFEGQPVCTASVCVPDYPFEPQHTAIKDYSENEGVLSALISAGVVARTENDCLLGLIPFPVVRILD